MSNETSANENRETGKPRKPGSATVFVKAWESDFLGLRFGQLQTAAALAKDELEAVLEKADADGFSLIEWQCAATWLPAIPSYEAHGFRLVDSRISFMTLIDEELRRSAATSRWRPREARSTDLPALIRLTHQAFTDNPDFYSRYKNPVYYRPAQSRAYYQGWIENHLGQPDVHFGVIENEKGLAAYSFFKRREDYRERPCYKAILTAVASNFRGRGAHAGLQNWFYQRRPKDDFYLDNSTQLNNYAALKSNARTGKEPAGVDFVLYRRQGEQ